MQTLDLNQDYFTLFGLPSHFNIDLGQLHAEQQRLQAAFHPDRFVNASDQEQRLSVQQAAWINEAYATLAHPVKRARYMLLRRGLEINDESETTDDTAFLMEQIGLREEIDACRSDDDPLSCCDNVARKLQQRAQELGNEFIDHFDRGDLQQARHSSRKMQFIERVLEQLTDFQVELEDELA